MRRKDSFYSSLFLILPFLFLSDTLTSRETFFMRDLTYLFHPWRTLASQMMQAGEMPLWNPYAMGGMPFLANCQSAILYPFTIFFFHFSFVIALKLFHLFHYALAGLGFYLFARKIGLPGLPAFVGGILFSFNGYSLTRLEFLSALGSLIWLPWILLFLSGIGKDKLNWKIAIATAIVFSFSLFAGFPQIVILQILAAALYLLLCCRLKIKKFLFFLGLSSGFFLFLAAVQWLPTAELFPHSIRGGEGITYQEAGTYSLPVDSLFGLILPTFILEHPDRFTGEKYFWIWSGWWGLVASFLLLCSFRVPEKRVLIFGWTLFFLGILWSIGTQFESFKILHENFFLFKLFRYPPVALYWTVTAAALLSACSLSFLRLKGKLPHFLAVLLLLELWLYGRNILPTVIPEYFSVTFPAVESLIKEDPGMVMLSPKLERQRRLAGMTHLEAKMRFRGYLFDLTNLPYRIRSFVPSGEPLALKSFEKLYAHLSKTKSVEEATPFFNLWNITHFLTNDELKNKWERISQDKNLKLYKNPDAFGAVYALPPEDSENFSPAELTKPIQLKLKNNKQLASFKTSEKKIAIFNLPFYPGWKLFCSSCETTPSPPHLLQKTHDYFTATNLNRGEHHLFLVYQPKVWRVSLLLTILAVTAIAFLFLRKIHATLQR